MHVLKLGGAAGADHGAWARSLVPLCSGRGDLVVVHGGSDEATRLGTDLGHPPRFVTSPSGHQSRYTDAETLRVFLMATALVNRRLVAALQAAGVRAVGLSGIDGALLRARRKDALRVVEDGRVRVLRGDHSGRPTAVGPHLLRTLLDAGYVPVVAPVALAGDGGPVNVDGDRAAAALAGALGAERLTILTNVPGVLARFPDPASLVAELPGPELDAWIERVGGRMRKKLLAAGEALAAGVGEVRIAEALDAPGTRIAAAPASGPDGTAGAPDADADAGADAARRVREALRPRPVGGPR